MKKLVFVAFVATIFSANTFAKGVEPVVVESGSLAFVKQGGTATVFYDYSNLRVAGVALNDFLSLKDDKFRSDWEYVIVPSAETSFAGLCTALLNKNKFSVQADNGVPTDYSLVMHLTDLDLGNMSGVFNPFSGMKGGGATISGKIECVDNNTGGVICVINFNEVKGVSTIADKDRWSNAYFYLIRGMQKIVKKSK